MKHFLQVVKPLSVKLLSEKSSFWSSWEYLETGVSFTRVWLVNFSELIFSCLFAKLGGLSSRVAAISGVSHQWHKAGRCAGGDVSDASHPSAPWQPGVSLWHTFVNRFHCCHSIFTVTAVKILLMGGGGAGGTWRKLFHFVIIFLFFMMVLFTNVGYLIKCWAEMWKQLFVSFYSARPTEQNRASPANCQHLSGIKWIVLCIYTHRPLY